MDRLLCIVSSMNAGGAETFLMKLYRKIDRSKYQMDFCVSTVEPGFYDEEIKKMGGRILHVTPKSRNLSMFRKELTNVVKENKYEYVMRVTSNSMGFMDLAIAKKAGAKRCIARSSNSSDGGSVKSKFSHILGKILYSDYVDVRIAPSDLAAEYTFGKKSLKNGKVNILHNAIDLDIYKFDSEKRKQIREEFGVREDEILLGHIGRFAEQKNHRFLIKAFAEVNKKYSGYKLMLVGKGELEEEIADMCSQLGVRKQVIFTGVRSDIPALLSAMDVFVFPSLYEGMPNTVIEAQATGLPCLVADTVTKESNLGLVKFISINQGIKPWSEMIERQDNNGDRIAANRNMVGTQYDIDCTVSEFVDMAFK